MGEDRTIPGDPGGGAPMDLPELRKARLGNLVVYADKEHHPFLAPFKGSQGLMDFSGGVLVDRNTDKCVVRLEGPLSTLYLKRFWEERLSHRLKRFSEQGLRCLARHETDNIRWLRARGIHTADLAFWGHTTFLGLDGTFSFLGVRELSGYRDLDGDPRPEGLAAGARLVLRLVREGFYWPDAKPKHFFFSADGSRMALVDLHGGRPRAVLKDGEIEKMLRRFLEFSPDHPAAVRQEARRLVSELASEETGRRDLRERILVLLGRT